MRVRVLNGWYNIRTPENESASSESRKMSVQERSSVCLCLILVSPPQTTAPVSESTALSHSAVTVRSPLTTRRLVSGVTEMLGQTRSHCQGHNT